MEKVGASWVFLLLVVVIYVILAIIDFELVGNALYVFGRLILRIFPVLIVVFGIMFLTNLLFEA
ncbi:MAG: hypothetical protein KAV87_67010, partial [Desulfobacteraceae bacterium]|nr:hypothetical protein [Desulfobacteraceae bacterium]